MQISVQKHTQSNIFRRSCVAFTVLGIFLGWVWQPTSMIDTAKIVGSFLFTGAVFGVLLSWPNRKVWRIVLLVSVAVLVGTWRDLDATGLEAVVVVLFAASPALFVALTIAGADWIVVRTWRLLRRSGARAA